MRLSEREYLVTEALLRDAFRGKGRGRLRIARLVLAETGETIGNEVVRPRTNGTDDDPAGDAAPDPLVDAKP